MHGGQFDWGGCLQKRNASVQRSPQSGWKSDEEYISIRRLYCEGDISSSCESRFKWPFGWMWNCHCLTDISYPGDNRLVVPDSSYWRHRSAPRCRLVVSWVWISTQGLDCSSIKTARELGSDRREPGRSLSGMGVAYLRELAPSTRGSGRGKPLVYQLFCQEHCWVAMLLRDKHWKHISAKPVPRLDMLV